MSEMWFKQSSENDNSVAILKNLVYQLNLPVTNSAIEQVKYYSNYPSLQAINIALQKWNVQTKAIRISTDKLSQIPFPAILHFSNPDKFVVATDYDSDNITYIDTETGKTKETLIEFNNKWDGIALLVSANKHSGEIYYQENKLKEQNSKVKMILKFFFSIVFILSTLFIAVNLELDIRNYSFALFFLKFIGVILSLVLLNIEKGNINSFVNRVCNVSKKINCHHVLASPFSSVFGISLAEIGLFYFISGFFTIVFGTFVKSNFVEILGVISLMAIPISLFLLGIQTFRIKAFCPFCILIQSIILFEGFFYLIDFQFLSIQIDSFSVAFVLGIFSLISIFILLLNNLNQLERENRNNKYTLYKLKENAKGLYSHLIKPEDTIISKIHGEIDMQISDSNKSLIVVFSLFCSHCAFHFNALKTFISVYSDFNLKIRFLFSENENSLEWKVIKQLFLLSENSENKALEALTDWFSSVKKSEKDIKKWLQKFSINKKSEIIEENMKNHLIWIKSMNFTQTPTFLINNLIVPSYLDFEDVSFLLKN